MLSAGDRPHVVDILPPPFPREKKRSPVVLQTPTPLQRIPSPFYAQQTSRKLGPTAQSPVPKMSSSSISRARPSPPSFSLLFFATLLLLALTSISTFARPSRPHGSLGEHKSSFQLQQSRSLLPSGTRPKSPRPTPEPVSGGLVRLMATWKTLPTLPLPDLIAKRATTCYGSSTTAAQVRLFISRREELSLRGLKLELTSCFPFLRSTATSRPEELQPECSSSAREL